MGRIRARVAAAMAAMILVSLAAWPATAAGGEATLTLDNDFFAGFDRHYTNGFQLAVLGNTQSLPRPVRALQPLGAAVDSQYTFAVGQRIYTPADTTTDFADPRDRPYAGWLYALVEFRTRRTHALDHFVVSVGVVGAAALGRHAQNAVHRVLGEDDSRDWNAQLHNERGMLLAYERAVAGGCVRVHGSAGGRLHSARRRDRRQRLHLCERGRDRPNRA
jgi:hypothetical protein